MAKYRKKPIVIEAVQFTGNNIRYITNELDMSENDYGYEDFTLIIHTLEGTHIANIGDWIVKGVANEFYPVKPDIFAKTYEKVEEAGMTFNFPN